MNYRIEFFKVEKDRDEKGKLKKTGSLSRLGDVVVDDTSVTDSFPLVSKAFRHASEVCQTADKVVVHRLS